MRRSHAVLVALTLFAACSNDPEESTFFTQITRVTVSPSLFLGSVPCQSGGGMTHYQARLLDVTESLENAFVLPSSPVVPCTSDVSFEFVQSGHRYIAEIVGFDREDLSAQNPGSPVVVDEDGRSVMPRFRGTCWGRDGVTAPGEGGATSEGLGGLGGGSNGLGALAYDRTEIFVRGCEELVDYELPGPTSVQFSLEGSLGSLVCGTGSGDVAGYSVTEGVELPQGEGGAGGASQGPLDPTLTACDESLTVSGVTPDSILNYTVWAYEADQAAATWSSTCSALTQEGVTVDAACTPLVPLR